MKKGRAIKLIHAQIVEKINAFFLEKRCCLRLRGTSKTYLKHSVTTIYTVHPHCDLVTFLPDDTNTPDVPTIND